VAQGYLFDLLRLTPAFTSVYFLFKKKTVSIAWLIVRRSHVQGKKKCNSGEVTRKEHNATSK